MGEVVLIVDDTLTNRTLLSRRLEKLGYATLTAGSGSEALRIVAEQPVSLMMLDMMMPEMSGLEVLRQVRQTHSELALPILMISANTGSPQVVEAIDLGANDYLTKPFDFPVLEAKVRRVLALRSRSLPKNGAEEEGLGHYKLGELLGQGGMGEVYRGRDDRLERDVAVKLIRKDLRRSGVADRFLTEARAVARIQHPGVVTIHDIVIGPPPYIVMELLNGTPLSTLPLPVSRGRVLSLMTQVLSALEAVHQAGVVHRDLKPSNIMVLTDDTIKVLDFGLALIVDEGARLTMTGEVIGTLYYMAPEQIDPAFGEIGPATDQFAAAALIYELLTGQVPFAGNSLSVVSYAILSKDPPRANEINPDLSDRICDVLERALAKKTADRFPSCAEFARALEAAAQ